MIGAIQVKHDDKEFPTSTSVLTYRKKDACLFNKM